MVSAIETETKKKSLTPGKLRPRAGDTFFPTTTLAESGLSAQGRTKVKRLHVLIYGPPGTAKTVISHQLPNTRTLDFDDGMQSVEWAIKAGVLKRKLEEIVYRTILPPKNARSGASVLDIATDTLDEWVADEDIPPEEWDRPYPQFWDTLIIDSASPLTDAVILKGLKENDRLKLSKSWSQYREGGVIPMKQQDWGSASSLFSQFINYARSIGKNVVLICHEYHNTDEEGNLLSVDPLLIGQLRQKLPGSFDEVWYTRVEGTRQEPKYVFQTTPDPKHRLRSRLGCLDPIEDTDFSKIKRKVARFYGVDEDLLWVAAHGTKGIEEAVKEEEEDNLSRI